MRLMCLVIFLHGLLALLLSSHLGVITGEGNHAAQKTDIPPQVAQEITDLKKILLVSPGDPAALFSLALDYATIGDKTKAFKLLEEMSLAHAALDPQPPAGRTFRSMENDPTFGALLAKIGKENPPVIRSTTTFVLKERDLAPEGIAYDPIGRNFYG